MFGKSWNTKQRFRCKNCFKTFIWKQAHVKKQNEQHWFKLWVLESYSTRQLSQFSGYSQSKLKRIKNYWLNQKPNESFNYSLYRYLLFDGTYFHTSGCLMNLIDAKSQRTIANQYAKNESYQAIYPWLQHLKEQGLAPFSVTMDGHLKVIEAIKAVWPNITIQRCLYHIQRQGLMWLRTYPKTEAGKRLRFILSQLTAIRSLSDRDQWINNYKTWQIRYQRFVRSLPSTSTAFQDLKKAMGLINNALPDMFHYLKDQNIPSTTNLLESFYSRLKADYQRHRGMSSIHKMTYLQWYCYLKNINIP